MSISKSSLGYVVQAAGIGALIAGTILSVRHALIAAFFLGGAAALYIGKKIRALAA